MAQAPEEAKLREAVRELLEHVTEWTWDDDCGYSHHQCQSCGWDSRCNAGLAHHPGCKLRAAMDVAEAFVGNGDAC
jgi:hypothetical protein